MKRYIILITFYLLLDTIELKMNVLFLVSDDLRPQIGAYLGKDFPDPVHPPPYTPNLDNLASRSLLLKNAYVQQSVCSPSRTSLLTGRRPDTTHVYRNGPYFRDVGGNFTTIPGYFKQNGYFTAGMGKIFHAGKASGHDDPISWTEPYYHAPNFGYYQLNQSWKAISQAERKMVPLPDEQIALHAIKTLRQAAPKALSGERPFFIAAGFHKPHLPFAFPEEFLQYYPESSIRLPPNPYVPKDFPPLGWFTCTALTGKVDIKKTGCSLQFNTTLPDFKVLELRRAYYSAISFVDALVGAVIQELESLGLANNTIVSFWGDHGWELGEHNEWCKQTNFDLAVHAPMMIRIPGMTDKGIVTEQLTEFVDLFPTLAEAAGLQLLPLCPRENSSKVALCREGTSLIPLIRNRDTKIWKKRVFSQFPRVPNIMGYTMKTDGYRYTEWVNFTHKPLYKPIWNELVAAELYNHGNDPYENVNQADQESYKYIRADLSQLLHQGWREAMTEFLYLL